VKNKQKKALVRFLVAGAVGLIIHKFEEIINEKTDERYPDENSDQKKTN
jgi:hypothetical protein